MSGIADRGPTAAERTRDELAVLPEAVRLLTGTLELSEVLQRLTELVRTRLGVDVVRIWLQEETPAEFRLYAQAGVIRHPGKYRMTLEPGEGLVGWIMARRASLTLTDLRADPRLQNRDWMTAEGLVSFLGVPLLLEGAPVGVLAAMTRQLRAFSPEEVALAELLAIPAAIAIGNARLYRRAEERAERLTALSALTRLITSASDSREVFHAVAEAATTLLRAKMAWVWVDDPASRAFRSQARYGLAPELMADLSAIPYGRGVVGSVFESQAPEYIVDIQEDSRWLNPRLAKEADLHACAAIPLITGDRVVGVLIILFGARRQFTPEEKELMSLLADQAAITIERSRLFEELQRSSEEIRRTQDRLVRGETLRAVGEMASGIAHHLNNLLAVILGRIQLLRAKVEEPELRRALEIVERTTLNGAEVVRRVQEFSRAQPVSEAVPVDLNQLAQDVLELTRPLWQAQAQVRGIQIQTVLEPGQIPAVAGVPAALREVFMNLLLNAVDALPRDGQITVKTWATDQRVHCSVADTGVGMSEEVKQRALEPFFTTKGPRSTGLGLSVTYGIIKRHGGELSIESIPGHGTTVTISLPFAAMAAPGAITAAPLARPARVLVIDDEPEVRETLAEILASQGHLVSQSASGAEGLSLFQVDHHDLVFTDLVMPGMNGWWVAAAVKALSPKTPVILVTGWRDQGALASPAARHVDSILFKPFQTTQVATVVDRALAGPRPPAP